MADQRLGDCLHLASWRRPPLMQPSAPFPTLAALKQLDITHTTGRETPPDLAYPFPAPELGRLQHTCTSAALPGLDHLLLVEKGEFGAREAKLTTQDLDVVLAHERCPA